jgi:tetratricopeptide (TPR) repeat protein
MLLLYLAQAKRGLGKLDQAEGLIREADKFQSYIPLPEEGKVPVKLELYRILKKKGMMKEAQLLVSEILNIPDSPEMNLNKASLLCDEGRFNAAINYAQKILAENRYDAMAFTTLTRIFRKMDFETKFTCFQCKADFRVPVFRAPLDSSLHRAGNIRVKNRILLGSPTVICTKCGTQTSLHLAICRNCFDDFSGAMMVDSEEDGKQKHIQIDVPCPSCSDRGHIDTNDPQETRFLEEVGKLLRLEDNIQSIDNSVSDTNNGESQKKADYWFREAQKCVQEGKCDEALEAFGKAMELAPERSDVFEAYMKFIQDK